MAEEPETIRRVKRIIQDDEEEEEGEGFDHSQPHDPHDQLSKVETIGEEQENNNGSSEDESEPNEESEVKVKEEDRENDGKDQDESVEQGDEAVTTKKEKKDKKDKKSKKDKKDKKEKKSKVKKEEGDDEDDGESGIGKKRKRRVLADEDESGSDDDDDGGSRKRASKQGRDDDEGDDSEDDAIAALMKDEDGDDDGEVKVELDEKGFAVNVPQKPMTAFFLYRGVMRPTVKKENPKASEVEIAKVIGEMWGKIGKSELVKYQSKARKMKTRYESYMSILKNDHPAAYEEAIKKKEKKPREKKSKSSAGTGKERKKRKTTRVVGDDGYVYGDDGGARTRRSRVGVSGDMDARLSEFDQDAFMAESGTSGKRRDQEMELQIAMQEIQMGITDLLTRMKKALEEDIDANIQKKPAVYKLAMVKEVVARLKNASLQQALVDRGILDVLTKWLTPLPDGSLPNEALRTPLLPAIATLPVEHEHITRSGIGKVLFNLFKDPRESATNKQVLDSIINQWVRGSVRANNDYAALRQKTMSSDVSQDILARKRFLDESKPKVLTTVEPFNPRRPQKNAFDYTVQPKGTVDQAVPRNRKEEGESVLDGMLKVIRASDRSYKASMAFVKPSLTGTGL